MMKFLDAFLFVLVLIAIACAFGLAHADELDDGYQACLPHKNDISPKMTTLLDGTVVVDASAARGPLFKPGWEHCLVIHRAWLQRNAGQGAVPVAPAASAVIPSDPKYQSTLDLATKLTAPPPPLPEMRLPQ